MAVETVKIHPSRFYAKLGVATPTQLAALPSPPITNRSCAAPPRSELTGPN